MYIFKNRPLCFICTIFLALSIISFYMDYKLKIGIIIILFIFIPISVRILPKLKYSSIFGMKSTSIFVISLCIAISSIFLSYLYFDLNYKNVCKNAGNDASIEAMVLKRTALTTYSGYYDILVKKIDDKKVNVKMKFETLYACDLEPYENFNANVSFENLETNINGFPEKVYSLSKGIMLKAISEDGDSCIKTGVSHGNLGYIFYKCNKFCTNIIKEKLSINSGNMISALLLGNKDDISSSLNRDFRKLGLSHMLAVSGTHLTIILRGVEYLLNLFLLHKKLRYAILIFITIFFMGLTGFSPSITRSAIMMIIYYSSFFIGRQSDAPTSLLLSVSIMCFINPSAIIDVGLIMSFFATLGTILMGGYITKWISIHFKQKNIGFALLKFVLFNIAITLSSTIFTLPVMWFYFKELSLISILSNVIFSPFITFALYLSPMIILFYWFPLLDEFIATWLEYISECIVYFSQSLAKLPNITISLRYDFTKYIFLLFLIGIFVLIVFKIKNYFYFFIPLGICILAFIVCLNIYNIQQDKITQVIYMNSKKNDGLVIISDRKTLLCDISDGSYAVSNIGNYLIEENCFTEIDTYMLTHYHNRHVSTLYKLISKVYIRNIYLPKPATYEEESIMNSIYKIAEKNGCKIYFYENSTETTIKYGKAYIKITPYEKINRSTHPIICLNVSNNSSNILYLGGSIFESQNVEYYNNLAIQSDVFIFGIHGPVIKKEIDMNPIFNKLNVNKVIYANDAVYSMINPDFTYSLYYDKTNVTQKFVNEYQKIILKNN